MAARDLFFEEELEEYPLPKVDDGEEEEGDLGLAIGKLSLV